MNRQAIGGVDVPFAPARDARWSAPADPAADALDPAGEDDAPAIDVRAAWATIFRSRYPIIAIMAAALLAGVAYALLMPRTFTARASIKIDQQVAKVLGTEDTEPQVVGLDADRFLQTQVDVLNSRTMAARVSQSLGLAGSDDFLKRMTGTRSIRPDPTGATRAERVVDVLRDHLNVDLKRNSRLVTLIFTSRDPQLAAQVANSYSSNYIEENIQQKFSASAYSRRFLQNQLALAKQRLEGSERELIGYARSAQLIDASAGTPARNGQEGPRSLVTATLVQLNADVGDSEANRLRTRERWEEAQATPLMSLPEVLGNEAIQRLSQRRAEQLASLSELRRRLKPDHPVVIQAVSEIDELDRQIRQLAEQTRASIRNQYLTAERQHGALARQVGSLKRMTLGEQDRSVRYNILKREVDTNRQLFDSLLQRFKEVSAEAGVATNNVTQVDVADAPHRPTSPRPLLAMAVALALGVGASLLFAFGRDYLDDSIRDPQDVESKLRIPLLGVVPEREDGEPAAALSDPKSDVAEAYQSVRSSIELSSNQGVPRSILVTGSSKSEGKSTTSFALARDFAGLGRRVLLIDADLRRPSLHRLLGLAQPDTGLSSALARLVTPDQPIIETGVPGLLLLPSGPMPPNPAALFAGSAMAELIEALGDRFEVIVIDGPPVLALADAVQIAAAAQATVFVVEAGGAHYGLVRNAVSRLVRAGGAVIGCVVTKYNARRSGYGRSADYYRYEYGGARD